MDGDKNRNGFSCALSLSLSVCLYSFHVIQDSEHTSQTIELFNGAHSSTGEKGSKDLMWICIECVW